MERENREPLSVLIADDHWVVRAALGHLLRRLGEVSQIEAEDADSAVAAAEKAEKLDLVLMDLQMPGGRTLDAIAKIRAIQGNAKIVMISVSENRIDVLRCLEQGAVGYIPKTADPDVILNTIRQV